MNCQPPARIEPETPQEALATELLLRAMRQLRLAGLSDGASVTLDLRGRSVTVRIGRAHFGEATLTREVVA